jgi:outer membrane protein OmpA-like peptidoglycan-associated protein
MAGSDSGAASGDPYAASKTNLRETIKWLASIFAGLAAVVIAGTPISGLGSRSLSLTRVTIGAFAVLIGFAAICAAVVQMLRLLRADLLYPSDIDPQVDVSQREESGEIIRIRADLEAHSKDLVPDYGSLQEFHRRLKLAETAARNAQQVYQDALNERPPDPAVTAQAKADYDSQIREFQLFRDLQARILYYAAYQRFYMRLKRATPWLFALGILALLALVIFTLAVQGPKEDKAPAVTVIPIIERSGGEGPAPFPPHEARALGVVLFDTDKFELLPQGIDVVQRARDVLLAEPETSVLLIARTDTVGPDAHNIRLARQRADAVKSMLLGAGGIPATRIYAAELAKSDLPTLTKNQVENAANRSVSLYLVPFERRQTKDHSTQ